MLAVLRTTAQRPPRLLRHVRVTQQQRRLRSTIVHHAASPEAAREVPTPLVLVSAEKWSGERTDFSAFVKHFTAHGWNVTSIELDPQKGDDDRDIMACKTSMEVLGRLEDELAAQMRKASAGGSGSPFPPMLVANGLASLVAETYVSSHPLSAMALLDPPLSPDVAQQSHVDKLPTPLEAFTYELRFPCLVAWSAARAEQLAFYEVHRIEGAREEEADEALDRYVWDMNNAQADVDKAGPYELRKWAEDSGIDATNTQALLEASQSGEGKEETETVAAVDVAETESNGKSRSTKKAYTPPTPPDWFVQGKYTRNPERNAKKYPLFLDESHLREAFIRGSGPGGQAINKLATCVQLTHIPTGMQFRSQETRSRQQNRDIARKRLSRELERIVFGERDSVLGREASKVRRTEQKKSQRRRKKEALKEIEANVKDKYWPVTEEEISASR